MDSSKQDHRSISDNNGMRQGVFLWPGGYLPDVYHEVFADGKVIYQGYNDGEMVKAFRQACRTEAKRIRHMVNGIEVDLAFVL